MSQDVLAPPPPLPPPPPPQPLVDVPAWQVRPPAPVLVEHPFTFDGRAGEYFRIWIVNLALSIVTLGLYSAWARVRTQRYFYGNTRLAGVPFEYLAKPWPILKGRIVAFVLFGSYVLASHFSLFWQVVLIVVILFATPWLIVRGAAFRARYSSWRGLSFRFVPDYGEAYIRFLVMLIPLVLTLGMLYPWIQGKQKQFLVEQHRYGGSWFRFLLSPGRFYIPYLIAWGAVTGWILLMMLVFAGMAVVNGALGGETGQPPPFWLIGVGLVLMYGSYFVIWIFLAAAITNLVYNHVEIDGRRLQSRLKGGRLLWLYAGNTVGILASAGLLIPWAKVRMARYRAECTSLYAADDLQDMRAERAGDVGATAAEVDGFFDIDVSL